MTEKYFMAQHIRERFDLLGFFEKAHLDLSLKARCILDAICQSLQKTPLGDNCYPSGEELAVRCNTSRPRVVEALTELVDKNLITITSSSKGRTRSRPTIRLSDAMYEIGCFLLENKIEKRSQIVTAQFISCNALLQKLSQNAREAVTKQQNDTLYKNQKENQKENQGPSGVSASHVSSEPTSKPKSPQKPPERRPEYRQGAENRKGNSWKDSEPKQAYAYHKPANEQLAKYREYDLKYKADKFLHDRGVVESGGVPGRGVYSPGEGGYNRDYKNNYDYQAPSSAVDEGGIDILAYHAAQQEINGKIIFQTPVKPSSDGTRTMLDDKHDEIMRHMLVMRARKGAVNA